MKRGRGRPPKISDDDIRELHADGCTNIEMAEIFGVKPVTITNRLRDLGLTKNPKRCRFRKQYAAYDRDTEQLLTIGTMSEIAAVTHQKEHTLFSYASALRCDNRPLPPILIREVGND